VYFFENKRFSGIGVFLTITQKIQKNIYPNPHAQDIGQNKTFFVATSFRFDIEVGRQFG
jgi:hypothetical protein